MTDQQDDNPAALDPVRKETGLVPRAFSLAEDPILPDVDSYLAFERGMNHVALGQYERAIQDYNEAIRLNPYLEQHHRAIRV